MATRAVAQNVSTPEFDENADVTASPEDWNWETVAKEAPTKIIFDTIGDVFVGKYVGKEHIEREPDAEGKDRSFWLHKFEGRDGDVYSVNDSFDLNEKMAEDMIGKWVRLTYLKDVKTERGLNAMKSFRVDVRQ